MARRTADDDSIDATGDVAPASTQSAAGAPATRDVVLGDVTRTQSPSVQAVDTQTDLEQNSAFGKGRVQGRERYKIIAEHGRGGLGRVSRARDQELERDVAIKELIAHNQVSELRFFREALITARLEHPGIVPVHEAGRWPDGTPFYAMKLVAGRPLRDLIAERATVAERLGLLHHVIAVADAIAYAHNRNIIHRDLKPANVIIGDFGETVVIDWGLAKDLTSSNDECPSEPSVQLKRDTDLTATGTVLGTPAYMAPEQARGENVDQRADVFAIGAMLWELCALQKVPPTAPPLRHRILRRANIDRDLITIIDKTLESTPSRRYANAGELAADLKAFKSGARIAARRYSISDILSHWIRRHHGAAIGLSVATLLAVSGTVVYVHNISTERGLTVKALARSEANNDALLLEHAELLLHSDPTEVVSTLRDYHGHDETRRAQLLAEANGRGVARRTLRLHNDTIRFLNESADGSIISLSEDHRVLRTTTEHHDVLVSDVSSTATLEFNASKQLLAYATTSNELALLDLHTGVSVKLDAEAPISITFSPDGTRLATIDKHHKLKIRTTAYPFRLINELAASGVNGINYLNKETLITSDNNGLDFRRVDANSSTHSGTIQDSIDTRDPFAVIGSTNGNISLLTEDARTVSTLKACGKSAWLVKFIHTQNQIAFGCEEGGGGIANYTDDGKFLVIKNKFPTHAPLLTIVVDPAGSYVAASADRTVYIYFIKSRMLTRYEGAPATIASLFIGSTSAHLLSGDLNGEIRVWDIYQPTAQWLAQVPGVPFHLRYSPDGEYLAVMGSDTSVQLIRLSDGLQTELKGHTRQIWAGHFSDDSMLFMSYSYDGTARAWDTATGRPRGTLLEHRSLVQDGDFWPGTHRVVTVGDDGRVLRWDVDTGVITQCFTNEAPLTSLEVLRDTNAIAVGDVHNAVWIVNDKCKSQLVLSRRPDATTHFSSSPAGNLLAIGSESGRVNVYQTDNWQLVGSFQTSGAIAKIVINPSFPQILVASKNDGVYLFSLDSSIPSPWHKLPVDSRNVAYSPDGALLEIGTNGGGSWFYSLNKNSWQYTQDHVVDIKDGRFSPDGQRFISSDKNGMLVIRNTNAIF